MRRNTFIILVIISLFSGIQLIYHMPNVDKEKTESPLDHSCPLRGIITVRIGGRLGNCIWEYASAVAVGHLLKLPPYVPRKLLECLGRVFQNLSVPSFEGTILSDHCRQFHGGNYAHCKNPTAELSATHASPWDYLCNKLLIGKPLDTKLSQYPIADLKKMHDDGQLGDIVILPKWVAHTEAILGVGVESFRQLFRLRNDVMDLVRKTVTGVRKSAEAKGNVSWVGVHVRRTDYNYYLRTTFGIVNFANPGYYERAMKRMRVLKPNTTLIFVIVSDDRKWCMDNLVNENAGVFWGGLEGSPFHNSSKINLSYLQVYHDFALLASLNESIISYGTFGLSGALLAGGRTIAFDLHVNQSDLYPSNLNLGHFLENWVMMN